MYIDWYGNGCIFSEKVYTENNSVKMILKRKLQAKLAQLKSKLWRDLHIL